MRLEPSERFSCVPSLLSILAVAVFHVTFSAVVSSAVWPKPIRPFTTAEQCEMAVTASDAIGVGLVHSPRDSIDDDGALWRWATFEPSRWLKGDGGTESLRVFFSTIAGTGGYERLSRASSGATTPCIAFLRRVSTGMWVAVEHPDYFQRGGVLPWAGVDAESLVIRAVAAQTLESITRRSSLIVIGKTILNRAPCHVDGRSVRCAEVVVDSLIAGDLPNSPLRVFSAYGGFALYPKVLLMLRPDGDGYQVVGTAAGVLPIVGDRVGSESLTAVLKRVRTALAVKGSNR